MLEVGHPKAPGSDGKVRNVRNRNVKAVSRSKSAELSDFLAKPPTQYDEHVPRGSASVAMTEVHRSKDRRSTGPTKAPREGGIDAWGGSLDGIMLKKKSFSGSASVCSELPERKTGMRLSEARLELNKAKASQLNKQQQDQESKETTPKRAKEQQRAEAIQQDASQQDRSSGNNNNNNNTSQRRNHSFNLHELKSTAGKSQHDDLSDTVHDNKAKISKKAVQAQEKEKEKKKKQAQSNLSGFMNLNSSSDNKRPTGAGASVVGSVCPSYRTDIKVDKTKGQQAALHNSFVAWGNGLEGVPIAKRTSSAAAAIPVGEDGAKRTSSAATAVVESVIPIIKRASSGTHQPFDDHKRPVRNRRQSNEGSNRNNRRPSNDGSRRVSNQNQLQRSKTTSYRSNTSDSQVTTNERSPMKNQQELPDDNDANKKHTGNQSFNAHDLDLYDGSGHDDLAESIQPPPPKKGETNITKEVTTRKVTKPSKLSDSLTRQLNDVHDKRNRKIVDGNPKDKKHTIDAWEKSLDGVVKPSAGTSDRLEMFMSKRRVTRQSNTDSATVCLEALASNSKPKEHRKVSTMEQSGTSNDRKISAMERFSQSISDFTNKPFGLADGDNTGIKTRDGETENDGNLDKKDDENNKVRGTRKSRGRNSSRDGSDKNSTKNPRASRRERPAADPARRGRDVRSADSTRSLIRSQSSARHRLNLRAPASEWTRPERRPMKQSMSASLKSGTSNQTKETEETSQLSDSSSLHSEEKRTSTEKDSNKSMSRLHYSVSAFNYYDSAKNNSSKSKDTAIAQDDESSKARRPRQRRSASVPPMRN